MTNYAISSTTPGKTIASNSNTGSSQSEKSAQINGKSVTYDNSAALTSRLAKSCLTCGCLSLFVIAAGISYGVRAKADSDSASTKAAFKILIASVVITGVSFASTCLIFCLLLCHSMKAEMPDEENAQLLQPQ
ncbi:hypothetical protein QS306_00330 [Paraburkholderia bonniea]|uniref:hypothetical protein n=1 Tax=Paraburkholderia bonniea TaxID=2152891 RepID=UPI0012920D94|nr:hypothetical protein [Paraburkholderia bonniea]WJF90179.1 hypothetical protein QS306_00330 [Paraburkholderia bonniea]WJF93493.1 hypothetical protein QS308_00330 [Paraburkholderia bonniea]